MALASAGGIYLENLPAQLDLGVTEIRYPLNYGPDALLDAEGNFRISPEELS